MSDLELFHTLKGSSRFDFVILSILPCFVCLSFLFSLSLFFGLLPRPRDIVIMGPSSICELIDGPYCSRFCVSEATS
jgi:hypothetical protein